MAPEEVLILLPFRYVLLSFVQTFCATQSHRCGRIPTIPIRIPLSNDLISWPFSLKVTSKFA